MKRIINLHINEKFEEHSDPVSDLGISVPEVKLFQRMHDSAKKAEKVGTFSYVSDIEWNDDSPRFISKNMLGSFNIDSNHKNFYKIAKNMGMGHWKEANEQFKVFLIKNPEGKYYIQLYNTLNHKSEFPKTLAGFLMHTKAASPIHEKFTPESDPISDMGIGAINKIFDLTKDSWSFKMGLYSEKEWKRIIEWMLEEYEPWEVIAILDHKIMRYAHEATNSDIPTTLEQFQDYNVKYHKDREEFEIDRILNNYRVMQPDYVEHYRNMAKEIGLFVEPMYEKFTYTPSDPVADMGIGGYSFETVSTGALIKVKPNYRSLISLTKNHSGQFSDIHGMRISHENCLVVSSVVHFSDGRKDIHIKKFPSEEVAREFRENWAKDRTHTPWGGSNNRMIVSKLQFERRFEIIERGFNQVKESLNEKFTDKSDPLRDMGIGLKKVIVDRAKDMFKDAQYEDEDGDGFRLVEIRFDAFTADVITNYPFAVKAAQEWLVEEFKTHELDEFFELETSITHSESDDHIFWNIDFKEKYEMIFSMEDRIVINYKTINESLNEKFEEGGDPVEQMGIGLRVVIDEWLEENDTEGDVEGGYMTPAMFIVKNHKDPETVKAWIEFLLREGKEKIKDWEEDYVEDMNGAGVKFIPNSKVLPHDDFSYEIKNGQCYLYTSDWSNFKNYFNLHGDIGEEFIEAVLEGDARRYFEYNYGNQQLNDLEDALSTADEQKLFDYLKPICEEHAGMELEADNISDLLDIVKEDIPEVHDALLQAYSNNVADAEEQAAYKDIVGTIRNALHITEGKYEDNKLILKVSEEALNKFFISWYLKDYGIEYWLPQYGWGGDFNLEYFIEDFENALE